MNLLVDKNEDHTDDLITVQRIHPDEMTQGQNHVHNSQKHANIGGLPRLGGRDRHIQPIHPAPRQEDQAKECEIFVDSRVVERQRGSVVVDTALESTIQLKKNFSF